MKTRIAIPVPTFGDVAYNTLNWPAYADAVSVSGGEPVRVALGLSRREAVELAATCRGVVLPGSPADVGAKRYGHRKDEASAPDDPARESVDELLLEEAERSGKPLLAICFGMQMLNVCRGGTLVQDLQVMPVNHSAGRSVAVAHAVSVAEGSLLASIMDPGEVREVQGAVRLPVNSSHHQAAGVIGHGLRVTSRCIQDDVVEGIESADGGGVFLLGVQWHPERTLSSSPTSKAIFTRFIEAARVTSSASTAGV